MVELGGVHSVTSPDGATQTPMQEIDEAYVACGFGKFHYKLIFIAFLGTVAGVLVTHTTSYLLPEAECDLHMDLVEKGLLNAAPFVGMAISSVVAGFLTDAFGRRRFLILGFGGIFIFTVMAGSSQSYKVLLVAKFFEGMFFAISISAHVIFLSEFCHSGIRDRVMICQSSFVAMAQIISPLLTWGLLSQDWKVSLFDGRFVLHTWNVYICIMSLWSLFACILYSTLPESPKYLVTQHKYDEARVILIKIYKENTGKPAESYPFTDIWKKVATKEVQSQNRLKTSMHQIVAGLRNVKFVFRKPLVFYLAILSSTTFSILAIYNILRLWFPQLSTIVEHYKIKDGEDLCVMLDSYTRDLKTKDNFTEAAVCVPNKSGSETYTNSIIVGLVCLCPYFVTGAAVNRVGKKALLITSGLISVGVTLGLRWASSKFAVVALFSVDTAISQLMKGLNQAFAVEFFPTEIRSLAVSVMMLSGRLGTLCGNIGFPVLLTMGCEIPFFTMTGIMLCVTTLTMMMPKKKS